MSLNEKEKKILKEIEENLFKDDPDLAQTVETTTLSGYSRSRSLISLLFFSLGLLTINALTASNSVIIPIQCEYFALEGLGKLLNTIKSIQKIHNAELDIEGLLLTMFDTRLRLSNQVVDEVIKHFGEMVFKTIIKRNIKLG